MFQIDYENNLYYVSIFILPYQALKSCSSYLYNWQMHCRMNADISMILIFYEILNCEKVLCQQNNKSSNSS